MKTWTGGVVIMDVPGETALSTVEPAADPPASKLEAASGGQGGPAARSPAAAGATDKRLVWPPPPHPKGNEATHLEVLDFEVAWWATRTPVSVS